MYIIYVYYICICIIYIYVFYMCIYIYMYYIYMYIVYTYIVYIYRYYIYICIIYIYYIYVIYIGIYIYMYIYIYSCILYTCFFINKKQKTKICTCIYIIIYVCMYVCKNIHFCHKLDSWSWRFPFAGSVFLHPVCSAAQVVSPKDYTASGQSLPPSKKQCAQGKRTPTLLTVGRKRGRCWTNNNHGYPLVN